MAQSINRGSAWLPCLLIERVGFHHFRGRGMPDEDGGPGEAGVGVEKGAFQ